MIAETLLLGSILCLVLANEIRVARNCPCIRGQECRRCRPILKGKSQ